MLAAALILAVGCGGEGEYADWCERFEESARAFLDAAEMVPEGEDPTTYADPEYVEARDEAARLMTEVQSEPAPGPIAADFELLTTTLPPDIQGTDDGGRYDRALARTEEFLRTECGIEEDLFRSVAPGRAP